MKKAFLISVLFAFVVSATAQEKYDVYTNTYFEKQYEILFSKKSEEKFSFYIMMASMDAVRESGGLMVNQKNLEPLCAKLSEAKTKYSEWVATAKQNNVTDLAKKMEIECETEGFFMGGTSWHFDFYVNLTFEFRIINGKHILLVRTGEMTASDNKYIDHDGFVFAFTSESEIDSFLAKINKEKVLNFLKQPAKADLFN